MNPWALVFLLVGGAGQGGELPPLPPPLDADEALVAAAAALQASPDPAARREAARAVLAGLPEAKPKAVAVFLQGATGSNAFPADHDLTPAWRRLDARWSNLRSWLSTELRTPSQEATSLLGAVRAVGLLEAAEVELVEAIAAQLQDPRFSEAARSALQRVTRREFLDRKAFNDWWATAREQGREVWLVDSLDAASLRELALWRRILAQDASASLAAIASPLSSVRALGLERLPALAGGADAPSAAGALRDAFYAERVASLRRAILPLVPQFHSGGDAMGLLNQSLGAVDPLERVEAARALIRVNPPEEARSGLVGHLKRIYFNETGPSDIPEFRSALLSGLRELAPTFANETEHDSDITLVLVRALDREEDRPTRSRVYHAVAALGWSEFAEVLLPRAADTSQAVEERSDALDALVRAGPEGAARERTLTLLHGLLGDEALDYRAIQCLRLLKAPESAPHLAQRLASGGEPFVLQVTLQALAALPADATALAPLLAFEPTEDLHESLVRAIQVHVGGAPGRLKFAARQLFGRGDPALAVALVEGFSRLGLSAADADAVDRELTLILADWLLTDGVGNGRAARVESTASRLRRRSQLEPAEASWPLRLARLEALRGKPEAACDAWEMVFLRWSEGTGFSESATALVIEAANMALAAERRSFGLGLLPEEDGLTPEQVTEVRRLSHALEALPDPALEVEEDDAFQARPGDLRGDPPPEEPTPEPEVSAQEVPVPELPELS